VFFELRDDGSLKDDKYFIEEAATLGAINGDTVKVKLLPKGRDARVVDIIEHSVKTVIGTYLCDDRYCEEYYVDPDDTKLRFSVAVIGNESNVKPQEGDKVEVKLLYYPERFGDDAEGVITAVFGDSCTREANYSAILHESGIVTKFSSEAEAEAAACEHDIPVTEGRADLRNKVIFTIDGADAKDLDDAISVEKTEKGRVAKVKATNIGECDSDEVIQLYVSSKDKNAPVNPWLCGFKRISLKKGESGIFEIELPEDILAIYDDSGNTYYADDYEFFAGFGQKK
jgi:exoribonuclease R